MRWYAGRVDGLILQSTQATTQLRRPAPRAPDRAPSATSRNRRRTLSPPSLITPLAALAVCLPYLLDLYRLIASRSNAYPLQGDGAVEALYSMDAWRGHQLLGPYSRYGWHHPGPALFYLLALPYRLFGPRGPGMYVGVVLLNMAALAAVVVVVGRRWGPLLGAWSAICLIVLRLSLGAAFFSNIWNPYVIVVAMVLFVVLAANGATGSPPSLAWALAVGTFLVQTHVSTAPAVGIVLLLAVGAWAMRRRRDRQRGGGGAEPVDGAGAGAGAGPVATPATLAGIAVTVLLWVPPVIDAFGGRASNLYKIAAFFTTSHSTHPIREAIKTSLASVTSVPFGVQVSATETMARSHRQLLVGAATIVLLAGVAALVSRLRHQPLGMWLVVLSLAGLGAGVVGGTRVVGPILFYLPLWQAFALITLLLALGASILAPARLPSAQPVHDGGVDPVPGSARRLGFPGAVGAVIGVAVGVTAIALSVVALRHTTPSSGPELIFLNPSYRDIAMAADTIEAKLTPNDRVVRVTIGSDSLWPTVAGIILDLERHGYRTTVAGPTQDWTFYFGTSRRPTGREPVDVEFFPTGAGLAPGSAGTPLTTIKDLSIFLNRTG
ncbi:MAG: hypothetical protein M3083_24080 [Actinomycetota bacterium]|nr:hypothetical protein [Actinomycetota bacterium]